MTRVTLISSRDALSFNDISCIFIGIDAYKFLFYSMLSLDLNILLIAILKNGIIIIMQTIE